MNHPLDPWQEHAPPSKSARKREMRHLQNLGERLVGLSRRELGHIPLTDDLARAVAEGRRLKSSEALRRQFRYIGRLLEREGAETVAAALADLDAGHQRQAHRARQLNQLRDRLLEEGLDGVEAVLEEVPGIDRQQLRALLLQARRSQGRDAPDSRLGQRLLRLLREADTGPTP